MWKRWTILLVLAVAIAACDSNNLLAPRAVFVGSNIGSQVQGTPSVVVTPATTSAQVNTPVGISISAVQNGASVPDGTLIQVTTSLGFFLDSSLSTTSVRTNNGFASVTVTSPLVGVATVIFTTGITRQAVNITFTPVTITP